MISESNYVLYEIAAFRTVCNIRDLLHLLDYYFMQYGNEHYYHIPCWGKAVRV